MYKSQTDLESICDPSPWDAEADDLWGKGIPNQIGIGKLWVLGEILPQ